MKYGKSKNTDKKKQVRYVSRSSVSILDIEEKKNIHRNIRYNEESNRLHSHAFRLLDKKNLPLHFTKEIRPNNITYYLTEKLNLL